MSPSGVHVDKDEPKSGGMRSDRTAKRHLHPHQYERLLKIIALLLPRNYCRHKELAKELGVSTRTLQRDIASLRERGINILQKRGGYRCPSKRGW